MKYLCPRDFRRGEMEENMKKLFTLLTILLICGAINAQAIQENPIEACEAQSDETKECAINEDGECECIYIISLYGNDCQGGDD